MEILTALQWAKKGFIPNEGAEGTEQWTNCYYSAKAVYFKDCEVHEDKIEFDLMVCQLEGWSMESYVFEIKQLIDDIFQKMTK